MILRLDDKYRIISDERNFILQRKSDPEKNPRGGKKNKEATTRWNAIGFWKDLSQALASYSRQVLRTEIDDTSLKTLSRDLQSLTQAIERIGEQCVTPGGRIDLDSLTRSVALVMTDAGINIDSV